MFTFEQNFISDGLQIFIKDTIDDIINDTINATILSTLSPAITQTILKDHEGFELKLNASYVTENQLVALRKRQLPSALQ